MKGAVSLSHLVLRDRLRPGDRVVDATCGNGNDTLFLARLVGPTGKVWGFDVLEEALRATRLLLDREGCLAPVELILAGHERLAEFVQEPLAAVVFNLGYLPGGDKENKTSPLSTLAALETARELLVHGGIITIGLYPGHPGGADECREVEAWAAGLPRGLNAWKHTMLNRSSSAPSLVIIEKA